MESEVLDETHESPKCNAPEALVLEPEVSEGSRVINEPASIASVEPVHFSLFPLPSKFLCKICVGISKWDHFLISKKANFVSSAAVEDCLYDKVYALDFAIEQFKFLYPTETPTEKRIKLFYEEEVGAKSTTVGSFNMYFNLSKILTN